MRLAHGCKPITRITAYVLTNLVCSKVLMYKSDSSPTIRLTVGTERAGLIYHLSCKRLEQSSGHSFTEYRARTNGPSADEHCLDGSYLTWLDRLSLMPALVQESFSKKRPPRPFVDRVHDWVLRMDPRIKAGHFFHAWVDTFYDLTDIVSTELLVRIMTQLLAMCVASFFYGGIHLLAWNAPFHAPIYSLLWKISGITIASLGVFPLLFVLLLGIAPPFLDDEEGRSRSACSRRHSGCFLFTMYHLLILFCVGACCFALLYVLARVYLVVESFLSLAYLPESAMVTPNFSLYFPHIG
jgi:hypothetical protein